MSFVHKWARAGLTTHPSQLKDLTAHAKANTHAERLRKMQPRLKSATLSRSVSGVAGTGVPSRGDVSRRVLGREVEAPFVKDRFALGAGGVGWGRVGGMVDKPVSISGFGPVSTSRFGLVSASRSALVSTPVSTPTSTSTSGPKSTPANTPTSEPTWKPTPKPTATPKSTPTYGVSEHKSIIRTEQTLQQVSIKQTQARENPAFSHLPPTAVLIATAKVLCSYVSKLPFFTASQRPATGSATVAADTNVLPTPSARATVADKQPSVDHNGDSSPRFPLTDEVLAYVAGSGAVQKVSDASTLTSNSLSQDDKTLPSSGSIGKITTLSDREIRSDAGFADSGSAAYLGRDDEQALMGECSGETSASLFMTSEGSVSDEIPAHTAGNTHAENSSKPQDFVRQIDSCLEEKPQEDSTPSKEGDIDAIKTSISKIQETKDSEQDSEAHSAEDSSDSEEEDVEIFIHPSANGPFHPLVPQFPSYNHPSHNAVLAYQHMGTHSLSHPFLNTSRSSTTTPASVSTRVSPPPSAPTSTLKPSASQPASSGTAYSPRNAPSPRCDAAHTTPHTLVCDFEQHVLQRPLPAAKFTACRAFKASACSDAYCIFDHDFGSTPCRDNVVPGMVCVTRDCHFKRANPSWTPASGEVPENLGEILCENGPVGMDPKWKKCCANINRGGGCRWGTGCRYSHALVGVACPEYAANGRCPRVRCPLKHGVRQGIAVSGSQHSSDSGEGNSRPETPAKQTPEQSSLSSSSNTPPTGSKRARDPESPDDSPESERPPRRRRTEPAPRTIHHPHPRTQRQTQQNPTSPRSVHSEQPTQTTAPSPDVGLMGLDSPSPIALDDGDPMDIDHEGFYIKGAAGEEQMDVDSVYW
ncbi:hypothetical protein EJ07DRAFT_156086 [Lizonia empirigonia]|nr:hypothetical protein EJ07DRAFT_156086 [Lizonia empirigonia]